MVQEHHARRLHYDFRLERDGVLKSWAVPKGIPETPEDKRLAVQVEDHPLDYAKFEGEIPQGQYGAGKVIIWDKGTYETKVWDEKMVEVILDGKKLKGRYVLVPLKKAGEKNWLMLKAKAVSPKPARRHDGLELQLLERQLLPARLAIKRISVLLCKAV